MHPQHPLWNDLVDWLASHGMSVDNFHVQARLRSADTGYGLYATCPVPPSRPLFTVPASALPNVLTLSPYYPSSDGVLTAVQLISLHLALYRPKAGEKSPDPLFGPYISVLPRDFAFHPLSWLRRRDHGLLPCLNETKWIEMLPMNVTRSLNKVSERFETDWKQVTDYLQAQSALYELFNKACPGAIEKEMQFLWAWLNVNTRCVYHRIRKSPSDPDNISLCPVLDFANHTTSGPHMTPMLHLPGTGNITLISPAQLSVQKDEEMYLIYGGHSNKALFVEYGFLLRASAEALANGHPLGELDVQAWVEELFRQRRRAGSQMKDILVKEGYWGDWTMHSTPAPAHPSFRLVTALRLYHVTSLSQDEVEAWRETLLGTRDYVSDINEKQWRKTLVEICSRAEVEAEKGLVRACGEVCDEWEREMQGNIAELWAEQQRVASGVRSSVEQGIAF
ncbi:hypothetical protein APHAL10511_001192 [Amanita phalloides]|nr:hypothetical protein APHAL10511_001192 [Amanita phalloides]